MRNQREVSSEMPFLVVSSWGISTLSKEGMGLLMGVV